MAVSKVSLKLLIDTNTNKVLFAEAGKDFVDFLFNILSLPVGTVIRLLTKNNMVGCLGNLYESVENISETYLQPNYQNKESLLKPKAPISASKVPLLLLDQNDASMSRKMYMCGSCDRSNLPDPNPFFMVAPVRGDRGVCPRRYVADDPRAVCPSCCRQMSTEVSYVAPAAAKEAGSSGEGGYVKGVVTYMVMDDLEVKPMSTISSITLLNKFNVKDVGALEERVVNLTMVEGLELLKASLQSTTVLTMVFLGNGSK